MIDQRSLELEIGGHPALTGSTGVQIFQNGLRRESIAITVEANAAGATLLIAVMTVPKHHDALAENATRRITGAYPGMEK